MPLAGLASALFGCMLLAERVQPLPFDAEHFHFPMASRVLEEGFAYLLSPESVRSTPVSYLWPALFGNDAASLHVAHVAAGMALCLLAFDTVRRLFSPWAGAIAAWGLVLSPLLRPFIAQPLTEAPFLLCTAIWWWGLVAYLKLRHRESRRCGNGCRLGAVFRPASVDRRIRTATDWPVVRRRSRPVAPQRRPQVPAWRQGTDYDRPAMAS